MKRSRLLLFSAFALGGCGASGDADAPIAGQWETRMELVSINGKKPTRAEMALLDAGGPAARRMCFDGVAPRVGDKKRKGRCTVVRAADAGAKVDRELECARPGNTGKVVATFGGTRARESYDFRITTVDRDAAGKPDGLTIVTRETGRRIGDCPAGQTPQS